jgi:hypothetical protein
LPDGHVYYDAGGEVFNPFGQAYDEAAWNIAGSYDPASQTWTNLGVPLGLSLDPSRGVAGVAPTAGFRGSSFSVMLPLAPNGSGGYDRASFLSAGGVLGTTPGAYFATTSSAVDTVRMTGGGERFTSNATGPLVNARWFSTAVVLPTGHVAAFNGTNRDDVLGPGTSFPVTQAEMFDPPSGTWSPLASTTDPRGYHNTAMLLPTGQILLGGSAPIAALDLYTQTLPGGFTNNWRDPSFQLYDPPYLHWGYAQPRITSLDSGSPAQPIGYGTTFHVGFHLGTPGDAVAKVALVRDPNITHVVDADQRSVELPFTVNPDNTITVTAPPDGNVAPPGDYMVFVDEKTPKGLVPSVAAQLWVGGSPDAAPAGLPSEQVVGHLASVGGAPGAPAGAPAPSGPGTGESGPAIASGQLGPVAGTSAVAPASGFWQLTGATIREAGPIGFPLLVAAMGFVILGRGPQRRAGSRTRRHTIGG